MENIWVFVYPISSSLCIFLLDYGGEERMKWFSLFYFIYRVIKCETSNDLTEKKKEKGRKRPFSLSLCCKTIIYNMNGLYSVLKNKYITLSRNTFKYNG